MGVRDAAHLGALAAEVDASILQGAAEQLQLPGAAAARLPLVKLYLEVLLSDALNDLANRADEEDMSQQATEDTAHTYVRSLGEALLERLGRLAIGGAAADMPQGAKV